MRIANSVEHGKILNENSIHKSWLVDMSQVGDHSGDLEKPPGYVFVFESAAWVNCFLISSHPHDEICWPKERKVKRNPWFSRCRGHFRRNAILVHRDRTLTMLHDCVLIWPGTAHAEWSTIIAIQIVNTIGSILELNSLAARKLGEIRLPDLSWSKLNCVTSYCCFRNEDIDCHWQAEPISLSLAISMSTR